MFIPFGSRILPSSWAPSISCFSVAYPRGVIFFTPSYISFSPGTFLLSFSLFLFSLCLFHSESSSSILLANSHKLATSWRVFNLCTFQISMYDRQSRKNYEESHRVAGKHHIGCPMRISTYFILLLVKLIFHPRGPRNWLSCFSSRCSVGVLLIVSLCTFPRCF